MYITRSKSVGLNVRMANEACTISPAVRKCFQKPVKYFKMSSDETMLGFAFAPILFDGFHNGQRGVSVGHRPNLRVFARDVEGVTQCVVDRPRCL